MACSNIAGCHLAAKPPGATNSMRAKTLLFLLLLGLSAVARQSCAADLALILLNDVSKSMTRSEFAMVKAGYLAAFSDPDIMAEIAGNPNGVAVAYVEFFGFHFFKGVEGWK